MILLDSTQTSTVLSWVGDVPTQGTIHNQLAPNSWRFIMVPLDQYGSFGSPLAPTGTAATLGTLIPGVEWVMKWDATAQAYVEYFPQNPDFGDPDYPVYIGYAYFIRTGASAPAQWP